VAGSNLESRERPGRERRAIGFELFLIGIYLTIAF